MRRTLALAVAGGFLLALTASGTSAANIVKNGSLEDLKGKFTDTRCNYMALHARSRAIAQWTVARATTGELAWGKRTCDGYSAARGAFFLDLSGFGADSTNGAIRQTVRTRPREALPLLDRRLHLQRRQPWRQGQPKTLSLSPGQPFVVGSTSWTPMTGDGSRGHGTSDRP